MTISICVPVYGVEKYIERCARSLFEQTYEDIEYIFVDDCSTDKSIEILHSIIEQYPMRKEHVRILKHERNRGLAAARNTAVECCRTEFLMHVDSDDWIDDDAVEKLIKKQNECNADIVVYDVKMHFPDKILIRVKPKFSSSKELVCSILRREINSGVCGSLLKYTLYTDNNICVEEGVNMSEDFQVYPRLAFYAVNVATLNGVYYHYNFSNNSSYTHNETINTCKQTWRSYEILEEFFINKSPDFIRVLKEGKKKSLARQLMSGCKHGTGLEIFKAAHIMLKDLQDTNNKVLNKQEKLAIMMPSFRILKLYVNTIDILKSVFSFIHNCKR